MSTESLNRLVQARLSGDGAYRDHIRERVRARVAERLGVEASAVPLQWDFTNIPGADSLNVVEVLLAVEDQLGIQLDEL